MSREDEDELPPTLGVREPRTPSPPSLSGTTAAPLEFTYEQTAEVSAQGSRVEIAA